MKTLMPSIRLAAKPAGLTFKAPKSAMDKWDRTIQSKVADSAAYAIDIMGEIGDSGWTSDFTTAAMVKQQLKIAGKSPVTITLNSPGGDAFEGIAIYNLLREHPGTVNVKVLGLAASAASVIAMAGDTIEMGEAAFLMIHSAWGVVMGNRNDMREFADTLDQLDSAVAELYARRARMSVDDVIAMMEKETWMTGPDAVKHGFADTAIGKSKAKALAPQVFAQTPTNALLAASGDRQTHAVVRLSATSPGASGHISTIPKDPNMNTAEEITAFAATRAADIARLDAIMKGAAGRSLDESETQEYDTVNANLDATDKHLVRLKAHEARMAATATPVSPAVNTDATVADTSRPGRPHSGIVSVKQNAGPGIAMTRYIKSMVISRGNPGGALQYAQAQSQWSDQTPEVAKVLMAAVAAGDTTTATWAAELVYNENLASAFLEYLRPKTIIGRIPSFTKVPFNVRWGSQTSGATAYWVNEGSPIPVSKYATGSGTLGIAKAAGLIVLTKELMMSSSPDAEALTRDELVACITQFLDQRFIAPDYAASGQAPASVTNGVTPVPASGTALTNVVADLQTIMNQWNDVDVDYATAVWITTPRIAMALGLMKNSLGQKAYPDINVQGGSLEGIPVIVSNSAKQVGSPVTGEGNMLILLNAKDIAMADEGGITIDASSEASIQMLDNPTNATTSGTTATTMVSMYQTDSVAIRAIRFMNWVKRRSTAVVFVKDAAYVAS